MHSVYSKTTDSDPKHRRKHELLPLHNNFGNGKMKSYNYQKRSITPVTIETKTLQVFDVR